MGRWRRVGVVVIQSVGFRTCGPGTGGNSHHHGFRRIRQRTTIRGGTNRNPDGCVILASCKGGAEGQQDEDAAHEAVEPVPDGSEDATDGPVPEEGGDD